MKNKFLMVVLAALILFGVWNLAWLFITKNRYHDFTEAIPKTEGGSYITTKDGYIYNVKLPDYLHFTGNLGIANHDKGEALIIWPLINGGYEYGIRLQKDGVAHEIYVDENMNPIDKNDTDSVQLIEKYKAEANGLLARANEMWDLN
ncbi:hypothetical protein A7975_20685 [Bacillus sp. FJAT-26390]|nr:hypothetical protein A7975_20685 [Bacillus sp. FJAT-26390]